MHFLYGVITAAAGIVTAEIAFDYSLGDFLKDLFIRVFKGAEAKAAAVVDRASARYKAAVSQVRKIL